MKLHSSCLSVHIRMIKPHSTFSTRKICGKPMGQLTHINAENGC